MNDPLEPLLRHRHAVRRLATQLVGAHDADDVVQETFLHALRRPPHGDARAWLTSIARNVVRFRGRSDARRRTRETQAATDRETAAPSAASVLGEIEAIERVGDALRNLAEPYRTTLIQRFFLDWSTERIAADSGVGEAAVRQRQKRGIELLRAALARTEDRRRGMSRADLMLAFGIPCPPTPPVPVSLTVGHGSILLPCLLLMKSTKTAIVAALVVLGVCVIGAWRLFGGERELDVSPQPASVVTDVDSTPVETPSPADIESIQRTAIAASPDQVATTAPATTDALLLIRARWHDDDTPAVGITVFALPRGAAEHDDPARFHAVTDADGRATIADLPPGKVMIDGVFGIASLEPKAPTVITGATTECEVRLERGAVVTGRVVDPDGRGIGGAAIVMAGYVERWARLVAETDDEGRFRLEGIAESSSIGAAAEGFVASRLQTLTVAERSEAAVEIRLARAATSLRIRVLDARGDPLQNALVAVGPFGRQMQPEVGVSGAHETVVPRIHRTDEGGRVALGGLAAGTAAIQVAANGHAGWIGSLPITSPTAGIIEHEVRLEAAIELTGRVVDSAGLPLAGVYVEHGGYGHLVSASTQSDADGRFQLRGLPAGEVRLHAQRRGRDLYETLPTIPGQTLRWDPVFDSGRSLRGRVHDHAGNSVAHAEVNAYSSAPRWHEFVRSGDDGSFVLAMPLSVQSIRVSVAPTSQFGRTVFEGPVPTHELALVLGPEFDVSARITGALDDGAGNRVKDARIWYGLDGQGNSFAATIAEDGSFSLELSPGTYRFNIEANGFANADVQTTVVADEQRDLGTIVLEPPAALRVEIEAPNGPPAELDLRLTSVERGTRHRLAVRNGVGELGALAAGNYHLQLRGKGIASEVRDVFLEAGRTTPTTVSIIARAGIDLKFVVTAPDGDPPSSAGTLVIQDSAGTIVVDQRVSLRTDGSLFGDYALAPGAWRVSLTADGPDATRLTAERNLVVPDGATDPIVVALELRR